VNVYLVRACGFECLVAASKYSVAARRGLESIARKVPIDSAVTLTVDVQLRMVKRNCDMYQFERLAKE